MRRKALVSRLYVRRPGTQRQGVMQMIRYGFKALNSCLTVCTYMFIVPESSTTSQTGSLTAVGIFGRIFESVPVNESSGFESKQRLFPPVQITSYLQRHVSGPDPMESALQRTSRGVSRMFTDCMWRCLTEVSHEFCASTQ